jgi:replicative DNA helicase
LWDKPFYLDETPGLSIYELRTKVRRLIKEHGVKVIFIDYLQLMSASTTRYSTRQDEVSLISRSLKALAKETGTTIIALSQMNRGIEAREGLEGKRPRLSDLRESGAIEQDADMVIFVHRPEVYGIIHDDNRRDLRGTAEIIIGKNRNGDTGLFLLTFKKEISSFIEYQGCATMGNHQANIIVDYDED